MISKDLAERLIERITQYTTYNVNIMNQDGVIIASRDKDRIGQYHEVAHQIIIGNKDIVITSDTYYHNVLPGINMVIEVDREREGVVGVTGDPDEIRPIALIVKMSIETMLKYERQQEEIRRRANKKEHFIYLLTQVEHSDPNELRAMADDLDYPEEMIRIPILVRTKAAASSYILQFLRESPLHSKKDFSFALNSDHTLVFKTIPSSPKEIFTDYKAYICEYLSPLHCWLSEHNKTADFFIGSFQDTYTQYYYAYRHCKWLEQFIKPDNAPVFFYDHAGEYLRFTIHMGELQHVFYIFRTRIPSDKLHLYMEMLGVLIDTNFNFGMASKKLFIHKNTLVYRYNGMKALLGLDPLASAQDRSFLEAFYNYLRRCGDI